MPCIVPLNFKGVLLAVGVTGAGAIALVGDLPSTIAAFKSAVPLLVYPVKAAVAFPLVYHYAGGLRHIAWDKHRIGNQADKTSLLENPTVDKSSRLILGISIVGTVALAIVSL